MRGVVFPDHLQDTHTEGRLKCLHKACDVPDVGTDLLRLADFLDCAVEYKHFQLVDKNGCSLSELIKPRFYPEFESSLRDMGAMHLSDGAFRIVFSVRGWIVKCVIHPNFKEIIDSEFQIVDNAGVHKEHFPEMYRLSPYVILQKEYYPDAELFFDPHINGQLEEIAESLGIADLHQKNVGFDRGGQAVFIDFPPDPVQEKMRQEHSRLVRIQNWLQRRR